MINDSVLNEAKRLHTFDWALHWLHPKSKRPMEQSWTKGDKKSWGELEKNYRAGMNLGVRLGRASALGPNKFLAVIDCDVKGKTKSDAAEMKEKLLELFYGVNLDTAPKVFSGRGNGSQHIYVQTANPATPTTLAKSPRMVKVLMPSSERPSKRDVSLLTEVELKQGYRMRPAWEISLMGDGQQVVLPPSLHPDTGKAYSWERNFSEKEISNIPVIVPPKVATQVDRTSETYTDFRAVDITTNLALSDDIFYLITNGDGCDGDKSVSMFRAALALCRAKFTDVEILSILTDPENYLGEVGYRHAQTKDRSRAASWVKKYCLNKARSETSADRDFEQAVTISDLTPDQVLAVHDEIRKDKDWRLDIDRTSEKAGSLPKPTVKNTLLILSNEFGTDMFIKDEFAGNELFGHKTEFMTSVVAKDREINDTHIAEIKYWLSSHYRYEPSDTVINDTIKVICASNTFHPVREYIDKLEWDGVPRIDDWLTTYMDARGPKEYLQAVGRKTLVAMIARVMQPGIKFDHVLILQGDQGVGKSSAVRALASPTWFTDQTLKIDDKDAIMTMKSKWVIEVGELSAMKKADLESMKEFVVRQTDRVRLPYGKRIENFPRQCIFIGTTNGHEYLRDPSGNRRFWPVSVYASRFKDIERDRDQLLAEAAIFYNLGEPLYLENEEVRLQAVEEQEQRRETDPYEEVLAEFFAKSGNEEKWNGFSMTQLFQDFGPLAHERCDHRNSLRAGVALRLAGFVKRVTRRGAHMVKQWHRKDV